MKIRNDYVTNSSSSSFVLAKAGEMNEKQKEEILKYIQQEFFGEKILTPENTEDEIKEICENEYIEGENQVETQKALAEGKNIYSGYVVFEECEYSYGKIFEKIWSIMEAYGDGNFIAIDGDLSY